MNDEDMGIQHGKRGPKKGSAQEVESLMWQALLGDYAQEIIAEAHRDIEQAKGER